MAELAADNRAVVYDTLFAAVAYAIQQTGQKWNVLQAKMAFTAILHSWGELLNTHPHLHVLVPGGGLRDGRWVSLPPGTFLPEGQLRERFRARYLTLLQQAYDQGELKLRGKFARLRDLLTREVFRMQRELLPGYSAEYFGKRLGIAAAVTVGVGVHHDPAIHGHIDTNRSGVSDMARRAQKPDCRPVACRHQRTTNRPPAQFIINQRRNGDGLTMLTERPRKRSSF
ncbi:MAG: hypothetical protein HC814_06505 [Rhodobacteraceae bacterium]|nr:hypothetical protein [Paracoccaceae bacterium]